MTIIVNPGSAMNASYIMNVGLTIVLIGILIISIIADSIVYSLGSCFLMHMNISLDGVDSVGNFLFIVTLFLV